MPFGTVAFSREKDIIAQTEVRNDGSFQISGLPPGEITVCFFPFGMPVPPGAKGPMGGGMPGMGGKGPMGGKMKMFGGMAMMPPPMKDGKPVEFAGPKNKKGGPFPGFDSDPRMMMMMMMGAEQQAMLKKVQEKYGNPLKSKLRLIIQEGEQIYNVELK
jgi:hypothetical protein